MFNSYKTDFFSQSIILYKLNYNGSKFELLEIVQILSGDDGGVSFSMLTIYDRPAALGLDWFNLFSSLSLILFCGLLTTTYGKRSSPVGLDGWHLIQKYKNNATSMP